MIKLCNVMSPKSLQSLLHCTTQTHGTSLSTKKWFKLMLESTVKVLSGHNSLCSLCGVVEIVLETISVANLLLEMTRLRYFENFSQRGL